MESDQRSASSVSSHWQKCFKNRCHTSCLQRMLLHSSLLPLVYVLQIAVPFTGGVKNGRGLAQAGAQRFLLGPGEMRAWHGSLTCSVW